ncbi:MAG TPA: type II secretion system protein [Patescibacteria group bacterium]|jgi:type II secretory pathway pseudopilin PulG|nr:type II secretion system protein [Patescibacteria group bacterium]
MKKNHKNGYTLVELLAVMIILVAVGTIISSILVSVLRASNKSTNTETVRRNGNSAIAQMSKMISYAQSFNGVYDEIAQQWTDCVDSFPTTKYYDLKITSFDYDTTTFICADSKIASQSSEGNTIYLVDPSLDVTCYFNCTQESAAAPAKIDIFLDIKTNSSGLFSESQAGTNGIDFETSVIIKNSASR